MAVQVEATVALCLGRRHELGVDVGIAEQFGGDDVVGVLLGRGDHERAVVDLPVDRPTGHADERLQIGGRIHSLRHQHDRAGRRRHRQRRLGRVKGGIAVGVRRGLLAQQVIGDVGETLPVVDEQIVPASPHGVGDRFADGLVDRRIVLRTQAGEAKELPHRLGGDPREKLSTRIGPAIFHGAGHDERPRRDHRQERVLVAGQLRFPVGIRCKGGAEPMRKTLRDHVQRLAEVAAGESRASAARLVGDDHGKPLV